MRTKVPLAGQSSKSLVWGQRVAGRWSVSRVRLRPLGLSAPAFLLSTPVAPVRAAAASCPVRRMGRAPSPHHLLVKHS